MIKLKILILILTLLLTMLAVGQSHDEPDWMPIPQSWERGATKLRLHEDFQVIIDSGSARLDHYSTWFLRRLAGRTGIFIRQEFPENGHKLPAGGLLVQISRTGALELGEDESYTLAIDEQGAVLKAETDLGAIKGLETFLQLIDADTSGYYLPGIAVDDFPRFPWRGVMIDVARHFQPVEVILRNLDAMAAMKLNILHLHLSDDQGIRVESKVYPQIQEKSTDGLYYTHEQIRRIVSHADMRGIRVVPEFDVPGHATAFLAAFPEIGSASGPVTLERNAGIFDPTLDPSNEKTYEILENLFTEMAALFPDRYFHIGGDENEGKHWDENPKIQAFMQERGFEDNHQLQAYFNSRIHSILTSLDKYMMGWEEIIAPGMPQTAMIHSWKGKWENVQPRASLYAAAKAGYKTILSNGYYLDLMEPASTHYQMDPAPANAQLTAEERNRIQGGEMCMWSELVVPETIDSRLWPRGAAVAERLWSAETVKDVDDMYRRLEIIEIQLEEHGLTHIKNREMMMRNLVRGRDVEPLRVLADVAEPLEGYTRNPGGTMYTVFSPFNLFADIALADAPDARKFRALVEAYLSDGDPAKREQIIEWLELWRDNHQKLLRLIAASPSLKETEGLSERLAKAATVGLEYLERDEEQVSLEPELPAKAILEQARQQGARTELVVIDAIESLILPEIDANIRPLR